MKHLLLLAFSSLFCLTGFGQNIPNGDFEDWSTLDHFVLDGWYASTHYTQRSTDAKSGNYSMRLVNKVHPNGNKSRGYAYSVDYANNEFDGHPFTDDVLSASFWSKHDLAPGDSARLYVVFRENGRTKATLNFYMEGSTNDQWVNYNVPLTWYSARTPDTVWVYFYAQEDGDVQGDGYIMFDDFEFKNIGTEANDKIYNHDFETWNNIGIHHPDEWLTIDLRYQIFSNYLGVHQSTAKNYDAYSGNYSLAISNYDRYNNGNLYYGYAYPGEKTNQYYRPSFPIAERFNFVQGYYKFIPEGEDSAFVNVRTFETGSQRSYNTMWIEPTDTWTYFSVPIDYYNENNMPDSASIIFYSSLADSLRGFGTTLFLDALEMTMTQHTAGIEFVENNTRIYPNPNTGKFVVDVEENTNIEIINQLGKIVDIQRLVQGRNYINLENNPSGLYTLLFNTDNKQWQKKIVKL